MGIATPAPLPPLRQESGAVMRELGIATLIAIIVGVVVGFLVGFILAFFPQLVANPKVVTLVAAGAAAGVSGAVRLSRPGTHVATSGRVSAANR